MAIKFPITVTSITTPEDKPLRNGWDGKCGDLVSVRPCADEYENKTYLGILLGDLSLGTHIQFVPETGELKINRSFYNPCIFIPDKNVIVMGCESWWGQIESPEQLKQITDESIENLWYVKALKQIAEASYAARSEAAEALCEYEKLQNQAAKQVSEPQPRPGSREADSTRLGFS